MWLLNNDTDDTFVENGAVGQKRPLNTFRPASSWTSSKNHTSTSFLSFHVISSHDSDILQYNTPAP